MTDPGSFKKIGFGLACVVALAGLILLLWRIYLEPANEGRERPVSRAMMLEYRARSVSDTELRALQERAKQLAQRDANRRKSIASSAERANAEAEKDRQALLALCAESGFRVRNAVQCDQASRISSFEGVLSEGATPSAPCRRRPDLYPWGCAMDETDHLELLILGEACFTATTRRDAQQANCLPP
jgi:hypothetical protein